MLTTSPVWFRGHGRDLTQAARKANKPWAYSVARAPVFLKLKLHFKPHTQR